MMKKAKVVLLYVSPTERNSSDPSIVLQSLQNILKSLSHIKQALHVGILPDN